jgi:integrase
MAMMVFRSVGRKEKTKPGDLIFSKRTPGQLSVAFYRLCRSLKIADFRFHDLRHTAASWMRMAGTDTHTVGLILGHKDPKSAARYQRLSPDFLADAVARLDKVFGSNNAPNLAENGGERYQNVTAQLALTDGTPANG